MSAIAGCIGQKNIAKATLARVTGRGQEKPAFWAAPDGMVELAVRQLRTHDLTPDGAQPAIARNGNTVAVFDGYVSNASTLRRELEEAGTVFRGHGHAELLVEATAHWGLNRLLQKLEGAFAFALWDATENAVHLVRDRMGAKPLYFAPLPEGGFAFASSAAALGTTPDTKALKACLTLGHIPAPLSPYKGVGCLAPGHRLTLRQGTK